MEQDERAAVYEEEGRTIYRASSFGSCLTMLAALRLGYEASPPPDSLVQGAFARGHELEPRALKVLKDEGWTVRDQQKEFDLALTARAFVRAHVDAIAEDLVIEVKSQSEEEFDKWDATDPWGEGHWQRYAWQVSVLMLATGLHCAVVRITPELRMGSLIVKDPPHPLKELRARHFEVKKLVRAGTLTCTTPQFPCPVWRIHPETKPEAIDLDDAGIDEHAKIYDHCRREIAKWEEVQKAARRALRVGIVNERVRTRSGIVVSFAQVPVRKLSEKMMKDAGVDPELYKEESISERITVTVPREDAP